MFFFPYEYDDAYSWEICLLRAEVVGQGGGQSGYWKGFQYATDIWVARFILAFPKTIKKLITKGPTNSTLVAHGALFLPSF